MISQQMVALKYARMGIRVFPCNLDKSPLTKNGFKDASSDEKTISSWWNKHPDAMVGSPNDQFTVVDIDDYDIPVECSWVVKGVVDELRSEKIIPDDILTVTTMSGGTHLYYKKDASASRRIQSLPQIDILASGGYVILPDQRNYIANEDTPWDSFEFLPQLDIEKITARADEMHDMTKHISRTVKAYREKIGKTPKKKSATQKKTVTPQKSTYQSDFEKYNEVKKEHPSKPMSIIDYDKDEIFFDIHDGIYATTDKEFEKADPKEKILTDGKLHIDEGMLDSKMLMRLFYNKEIQERLTSFLDLPVPTHKPKSTRSILPGHADNNPSMGVRWNERNTHIIVRDFSNHYSDKFEQTDYNLVRLYATLKYKTNVPRLNSPEFTAWFLRMLVDAGILNIDTLKVDFIKSTEGLNVNQKKMLESLQLLDAIKRLHSKYDGQFVAADKFVSAWAGMSVSTCNRHKKMLVEKGYIVHVGDYNCCAERKDGFFNTKLYKMAKMVESKSNLTIKGIKMKLSEAFTQSVPTPKKSKEPHKVEIGQDKEEKEVQDRYPQLSTYAGYVISPQHHETIKNFCEDFGIKNVPDHDNMIIPAYISDEYKELEEVNFQHGTTFYVDKFTLELTEGVDDNQILIAHGICPPMLDIIYEANEKYGSDIDEPDIQFIISSDVEEDIGEDRLEYLELMFNQYAPFISTNTFKLMHMTENQVLNLMDGWPPISED